MPPRWRTSSASGSWLPGASEARAWRACSMQRRAACAAYASAPAPISRRRISSRAERVEAAAIASRSRSRNGIPGMSP